MYYDKIDSVHILMLLWRNRQTRWTQNPVVAIPYRFDPGQQHHKLLLIIGGINHD